MRYSKQRELVLQKVEQLCDHPTAEEIYDEAIKEWHSIPQPEQSCGCRAGAPGVHPGQGGPL